jgi:hypothetical protein
VAAFCRGRPLPRTPRPTVELPSSSSMRPADADVGRQEVVDNDQSHTHRYGMFSSLLLLLLTSKPIRKPSCVTVPPRGRTTWSHLRELLENRPIHACFRRHRATTCKALDPEMHHRRFPLALRSTIEARGLSRDGMVGKTAHKFHHAQTPHTSKSQNSHSSLSGEKLRPNHHALRYPCAALLNTPHRQQRGPRDQPRIIASEL